MENKIVHKDKVIWKKFGVINGLYLDMPRKPEEADMSFPLSGVFGFSTLEEIFMPYLEQRY